MPRASDCAWDPRLAPPADALVVTKTTMDAGSSPAFVEATDAMVGDGRCGADHGLLAVGLRCRHGRLVCRASRRSSPGRRSALARGDPRRPVRPGETITRRRSTSPRELDQLRARGVVVCDTPDGWAEPD